MLAIVALGLSGVSMLACIIGTAIPYWMYGHSDGFPVYSGIWKGCSHVLGQDVCFALPYVPDWLKATRAFEIIGIIGIAAALGLGIFKLIQKDQYILLRLAAVCSFLAGACMLAGAIIFGVKFENAQATTLTLHAGFALCIVAGILAKVAGWCFIIGVRREQIRTGTVIKY